MQASEARALAHDRAVREVSRFAEGEQRDALQARLEQKYYDLYLADRPPHDCH